MAKRIVYNIEVDSTDAQGSIKRIEERLNELNQTANTSQKEVNTLQRELQELGQTRIDNTQNISSVRDLRRAYNDLISVQLQFGAGSDEFKEAAIKAGELRDTIDDARDSISNFNKSPLENLTSNLNQARQKLRGLDIDGFAQSIRDLGVNLEISAGKLRGVVGGTTAATTAFRAFGLAVAATGIGALIAGITILIRNFDLLKNSGGVIGKTFTNIGNLTKTLTGNVLKLSDALGLTQNAFNNFNIDPKKLEESNKSIEQAIQLAKGYAKAVKETGDKDLDAFNSSLEANEENLKKVKKGLEDAINAQNTFKNNTKELTDELSNAKAQLNIINERLSKPDPNRTEAEFRALSASVPRLTKQISALEKEYEELSKSAKIVDLEGQIADLKQAEIDIPKVVDRLRDNFNKSRAEQNRKAAEERKQKAVEFALKEFNELKAIEDKKLETVLLNLETETKSEERTYSERLRNAVQFGDKTKDVAALVQGELSLIFDQEFLLAQQQNEKLYAAEVDYYTQVKKLRDEVLIPRIQSTEDQNVKLELENQLAELNNAIANKSEEGLIRLFNLYSKRFEDVVGILNSPEIWDDATNQTLVTQEQRFAAIETLSLNYKERILDILVGDFAAARKRIVDDTTSGINTTAKVRRTAAGELAKAEQELDDLAKKRLNTAQLEIVAVEKLSQQQSQLTDSELERLQIARNTAAERINILKQYKVTDQNVLDEALFQQKVAEKNYTDFLKEQLKKRTKDQKEYYDKIKEQRDRDTQLAISVISSSTNQVQNLLNQRYNYEIQRAGENQTEINRIQKEQFETNKAFNIVNAIMNTSTAIMNIWANTPNPIAAGILTGIVAAIGVAEVAIIASQEFQPGQSSSSSFTPNAQGSQTLGNVSAFSPNVNFAAAGSGSNIQTVGGGSPTSVQFTGSISVSEINNAQQNISVYETNSLLGGFG